MYSWLYDTPLTIQSLYYPFTSIVLPYSKSSPKNGLILDLYWTCTGLALNLLWGRYSLMLIRISHFDLLTQILLN